MEILGRFQQGDKIYSQEVFTVVHAIVFEFCNNKKKYINPEGNIIATFSTDNILSDSVMSFMERQSVALIPGCSY
mgnify:CR=1 FL=1